MKVQWLPVCVTFVEREGKVFPRALTGNKTQTSSECLLDQWVSASLVSRTTWELIMHQFSQTPRQDLYPVVLEGVLGVWWFEQHLGSLGHVTRDPKEPLGSQGWGACSKEWRAERFTRHPVEPLEFPS